MLLFIIYRENLIEVCIYAENSILNAGLESLLPILLNLSIAPMIFFLYNE